jgi:hypothetical protein
MADARAELGDQGWRFFSGMHGLLLRVAGRVPDEWLTLIRGKLAGGDLAELPDHVSGAAVELGLPLTVGEVALLREMARTVFGQDPVGIDQVVISAETPGTDHRFFPVPEGVLATEGGRIPPRLNFTGAPDGDLWELPPALADLDDLALRLTDVEDQWPVTVLPADDDVRSVARAWRFPADDPPTGGVRVVLVEVAPFAPAWAVAGKVQEGLALRGVVDPQVEVFWTGTQLPPYHRAALDGAALLWAAEGGGA